MNRRQVGVQNQAVGGFVNVDRRCKQEAGLFRRFGLIRSDSEPWLRLSFSRSVFVVGHTFYSGEMSLVIGELDVFSVSPLADADSPGLRLLAFR